MNPVMYGTLILAFSSDFFFRRRLFIEDPTALPIPMNHYVADEKKLKTNSQGFGCRMIFSKSHTGSVARNSNIFYSVMIKYQLKLL